MSAGLPISSFDDYYIITTDFTVDDKSDFYVNKVTFKKIKQQKFERVLQGNLPSKIRS